MTVQEMLKGIAMASGNDASVAMAEKIAGSEENFVQMMNERAAARNEKYAFFKLQWTAGRQSLYNSQ